jgi:hypothetical protein
MFWFWVKSLVTKRKWFFAIAPTTPSAYIQSVNTFGVYHATGIVPGMGDAAVKKIIKSDCPFSCFFSNLNDRWYWIPYVLGNYCLLESMYTLMRRLRCYLPDLIVVISTGLYHNGFSSNCWSLLRIKQYLGVVIKWKYTDSFISSEQNFFLKDNCPYHFAYMSLVRKEIKMLDFQSYIH